MNAADKAREIASRSEPDGKVSKASVHYRAATTSKRCGNCSMSRARARVCTLVSGTIHPLDTCDKWDKK